MKKWLHLIVPVVLTVIFLFFYLAHREEAKQKQIAHKAEIARIEKEKAAEKAIIEQKAKEDAERRAAERLAADEKKERDRLEKWESEGRKIQDSTDQYNAEANALAKQVASLEIELDALRQSKAKTNAALLEQSKRVELALIAKRSAELEIQRLTEMIVRRAADSSLTRMPLPVAPAR